MHILGMIRYFTPEISYFCTLIIKTYPMNLIRFSILTVAASVLILSCGGGGAASGDKVLLQLSPESGKTYTNNMDMLSEVKVMGMAVSTKMAMDFDMTASEVTDAESKFDVRYNRVYMSNESMMGKMEYDSDKPEEATGMMAEMMKETFGGLMEANVTMVMDKQGRTLSISGLDDVSSAGSMGMGGSPADMQEQFGSSMAIFPKKSVGKGDSWSEVIEQTKSSPVVIDITYTVKEIRDNEVVLDVIGKISKNDSEEVPAEVRNAISTISGDMTGDMVVDRNTGMTKSSNLVQNMKMGVSQGGMNMDMDAVNTITLTGK